MSLLAIELGLNETVKQHKAGDIVSLNCRACGEHTWHTVFNATEGGTSGKSYVCRKCECTDYVPEEK